MRALVAIAIASGTAHADDGPITVQVGAGASLMRWTSLDVTYDSGDNAWRAALALRADFGYRVHPNVSIGVHAGISSSVSATQFVFEPPDSEQFPITYRPFEIALGATLSSGRVWFAPWYGIIDIGTKHGLDLNPPRENAFGFDAGYDVTVDPAGHRLGLFASLTHTGDWTDDPANTPDGFTAVTAGVAYRFW